MPASLTRPSSHPLSCAQLPPSNWSLHLPAWLVWPPLQRVLPRWLLWRRLPAALCLSEWCRLPQHHRELHLCSRLHGKMGGVHMALYPPPSLWRREASSSCFGVESGSMALCPGIKNGMGFTKLVCVPLRDGACDWRALKAVFRGPVLQGGGGRG